MTARPAALARGYWHDTCTLPSIITVQQPQWPEGEHPSLGEVMSSSSRRAASRWGCPALTSTGRPLTVKATVSPVTVARCSVAVMACLRVDAAPGGDEAVALGSAVAVEVENGPLVAGAPVEVAVGDHHLVAVGEGLGHDLARRGDDAALGQGVDALLHAPFGGGHYPGAVLVGAGLHDQVIVEGGQHVLGRIRRVVDGRVVSAHDQLHAEETHHPVGLRPAPVVADHHPHPAAEGVPNPEAVGPRLEVVALEVLERPPPLVVFMAGDVHLAVPGHHRTVPLDQDLGVVAVVLGGQFGVAQAEAHPEVGGLVEERLGVAPGHARLVPGVRVLDGVDPPSGEKGGQCQLGKHDQLRPPGVAGVEEVDEAADNRLPALVAADGVHLGGGHGDDAIAGGRHLGRPPSVWRSSLARASSVWSSTLAPASTWSRWVNSAGLWLIPPALGTNTMPAGQRRASIWASWPAPDGRRRTG